MKNMIDQLMSADITPLKMGDGMTWDVLAPRDVSLYLKVSIR